MIMMCRCQCCESRRGENIYSNWTAHLQDGTVIGADFPSVQHTQRPDYQALCEKLAGALRMLVCGHDDHADSMRVEGSKWDCQVYGCPEGRAALAEYDAAKGKSDG